MKNNNNNNDDDNNTAIVSNQKQLRFRGGGVFKKLRDGKIFTKKKRTF